MSNFITGKTVIVDGNSVALSKNRITVLGYFRFENLPFIEEISSNFVNNTGTISPIIENSSFGNGCRFRPNASFEFPLNIKRNSSLSVGFWMNPRNILPSVDSLSGEKVYYRSSLFDKANLSYSSSSGLISMSSGSFCFYEESRDENQNILIVHFMDEDDNEFILYTEPYDCDILHYFWISYSGSSKQVKVFIDGIEKNLELKYGSITDSISLSSDVYLSFNRSAIGKNSLLRNSSSLIDELIFLNEFITDKYIIASHINNGSLYSTQESLLWRRENNYVFGFDDPTSLEITSIFSNGNYIYVGRNDGMIMRGCRSIWESRRDFSVSEEKYYINKSVLSKDSVISFDEGALRLSKSNIQIK